MTYTPVPLGPITAMNVKMRFPEFSDIDDSLVEFAIEEASLFISDRIRRGAVLAHMYLSAHIIAIGDYASLTEGREIASETFGRIHVKYATASETRAGAALGDLSTTSYGRRYQAIIGIGLKQFDVIRTTRMHHGWDY
jgi:hypothetical protein